MRVEVFPQAYKLFYLGRVREASEILARAWSVGGGCQETGTHKSGRPDDATQEGRFRQPDLLGYPIRSRHSSKKNSRSNLPSVPCRQPRYGMAVPRLKRFVLSRTTDTKPSPSSS